MQAIESRSRIRLSLQMQMATVIPSRCQMAWTLWMLGYPAQAKPRLSARATATQFNRPNSTAFSLLYSIALDDFTARLHHHPSQKSTR